MLGAHVVGRAGLVRERRDRDVRGPVAVPTLLTRPPCGSRRVDEPRHLAHCADRCEPGRVEALWIRRSRAATTGSEAQNEAGEECCDYLTGGEQPKASASPLIQGALGA